jgi:hypothetical protein
MARDHDVLERGHLREQADVLERPGDAAFATSCTRSGS